MPARLYPWDGTAAVVGESSFAVLPDPRDVGGACRALEAVEAVSLGGDARGGEDLSSSVLVAGLRSWIHLH